MQLAGGFAIATQDGLFVLDDWTERGLNLDNIKKTFDDAATLDSELTHLEDRELQPLIADLGRILRPERLRRRTEQLLPTAARITASLAELRGRYATLPHDPDA